MQRKSHRLSQATAGTRYDHDLAVVSQLIGHDFMGGLLVVRLWKVRRRRYARDRKRRYIEVAPFLLLFSLSLSIVKSNEKLKEKEGKEEQKV